MQTKEEMEFYENASICLDCKTEVPSIDLAIPRQQWLLIHPDDGGVLCPNCILKRAAKLPNVINLTARITFANDSFEIYELLRNYKKI